MLQMFSSLLRRPAIPMRTATQLFHTTPINEAARKGTREKARKKKVANEIKKLGAIKSSEKNKIETLAANKHIDDSWKAIPTDDVYPARYYQWRLYGISEAIESHRQTHHPTMYDVPNAPVNVRIELNMQGEKKTRFVSNFQKLVKIEYAYNHGETRNVLALAKEESQQNEALEAGAALVGGVELIKSIHKGDVKLREYPYVIAHPNVAPELVSLRGLMKKNFPNVKSDTLGPNVGEMVKKCLNGINVRALKDENQENFGLINTCIGTLNMPIEHLISNFNAVIENINNFRPKRDGKFITRILISSPPSQETLKIDPKDFPIDNYEGKSTEVEKKKRKKKTAEEQLEAEEAMN